MQPQLLTTKDATQYLGVSIAFLERDRWAGARIPFIKVGSVPAHLRLAGGTMVENLTWQDCIRRYDRAHIFFYMDPPYWQTEGYGVPFGWENYEEMARLLRVIKGKAMVSINDHPDIRRVFDGLYIQELEIKYSVGNNNGSPEASRELVITNWEVGSGELF